MHNKISFFKNKKNAFTYLELIISMSLIVIVTLLTTPFLVAITKTRVNAFGEYKCYARYVDGDWKLFQNERLNANTYPYEDVEADGNVCEFNKPSGNVASYTITIYGGGGSGSSPYFNGASENGMNIVPGQNGYSSQPRILVDSLNETFTGDVLKIKFCDDSADDTGRSTETCIGKGANPNDAYDTSYEREDKINRIIRGLQEEGGGSINDNDRNFIASLEYNSAITNALNYYRMHPSNDARKQVIEALNKYEYKSEPGANTGKSGKASQLKLSNGRIEVVQGGKYGISDPYQTNGILYNKNTNMTEFGNNIYHTENIKAPRIEDGKYQNCEGEDPNKLIASDKYENFGAGGAAGGLICNLANLTDNSYSSVTLNENNNNSATEKKCYSSPGGRGAGGAIIIQWN